MIISLNKMEFTNEVHKIVNIFYPNEKIIFELHSADIKVEISKYNMKIEFPSKHLTSTYALEDESNVREIQRNLYMFLKALTGIEAPWGILVGIRPSKIALKLMQEGCRKEEIINYYEDIYLTSSEKAELCYEVALTESKYIDRDNNKISIYVGMPFCPTRCVYCSFASNPIKACGDLVLPYLYALKHEIEVIGKYLNEKGIDVQCLYFGGGTPTSVNDEEFALIMQAIDENISKFHSIEEYTVECGRPDSITENKLMTMKRNGVHRISINPQTMNNQTLKKIGRGHGVQDVTEKFELARRLGFDNINMDIIVGLPGESLEEVKVTCEEILKLKPESITVHGMSLKRASRLHEDNFNKSYTSNEKNSSEMYDATRVLASELYMKPYYMYRQKNMFGNMENIGYSKHQKECVYNIQMIEEKQTIIAFGADAVSKIVNSESGSIERVANVKDVRHYIDRVDEMIKLKIDALNKLYD